MKPSITAVIITKNEEAMLAACLDTLQWCDEILIIDDSSTDKTLHIAENYQAKIISFSHPSFARKRQEALKRARGEWLLYIDADERVTPQLSKEILVHLETNSANAYSFDRQNIFFGKTLQHGGWEKDIVTRLFRKESFKEWLGDIHETPTFYGETLHLHSDLIHLSHRDTVSGLLKTASWTPMEAELLYKAGVAPVTIFTIFRKGIMELIRRVLLKKGYKDGETGWIEGVIQAINKILIYIQIWERQQKPTIQEQYEKKEKEISMLWKKNA